MPFKSNLFLYEKQADLWMHWALLKNFNLLDAQEVTGYLIHYIYLFINRLNPENKPIW